MDELALCIQGLKLYAQCLKEYADIDITISDDYGKYLLTKGEEGIRFNGPTTDIKFRYGIIDYNKRPFVKGFYISAGNYREELSDEYQQFEKFVSTKFKNQKLSFYVAP